MGEPLLLELDGSKWVSILDFYEAVLRAIQAPEGHGYSPDALNDSMVFGGMNRLSPPYDLIIQGLTCPEVIEEVEAVRTVLAEGRRELRQEYGHDAEVSIRREGQSPVC